MQIFKFAKALNKYYDEKYKRKYGRDIYHTFRCPKCNWHWNLTTDHGTEHLIINTEFYCPWCGEKNVYLTDDEFR